MAATALYASGINELSRNLKETKKIEKKIFILFSAAPFFKSATCDSSLCLPTPIAALCMATHNDTLYIATVDGRVVRARRQRRVNADPTTTTNATTTNATTTNATTTWTIDAVLSGELRTVSALCAMRRVVGERDSDDNNDAAARRTRVFVGFVDGTIDVFDDD